MVPLLLIAAVLLIAIPIAPLTLFDGLPVNSLPEVVASVALLPLLMGRGLRRHLRRALAGLPGAASVGLLAILIAGLLLKAALVPARPQGFLACYQSTLMPPPAGPCERSFENPFFRFETTRIDAAIDFTPYTWDLSFVNALRFNFYPWEPGHRRRDRLPFTAAWRGIVRFDGSDIAVTYRGEGLIAIDGIVTPLPPDYGEGRTLRLSVPRGEHPLRVQYTYDDGSSTDDRTLLGPYAALSMRTVLPDGEVGPPIRPAPPSFGLRLLSAGVNIAGLGLIGALAIWYVSLLRRQQGAVLVAAAAVALTVAAPALAVPQRLASTLAVCAVLIVVITKRQTSRLVLAYVALVAVGVWLLHWLHPHFSQVQGRGAGEDWLTYESHARDVLETWSLQAGEPVFYTQPLFRYIRFAEHMLLGDGDPLINLLAWVALQWSLIWAAVTLAGRMRLSSRDGALFSAAAVGLVWLAGSETVWEILRLSLSEHVTWIFLPAGVALLSGPRAARWWVGAALLAAALITRPNQAPALFVAAVALLIPLARANRTAVWVAAASFVAVCLLPLAHNLYYGGQFVLFTTTADHPAVQGVPFDTLARAAVDPSARAQLIAQLRGLLFLEPWVGRAVGGDTLGAPLHLLFGLWVIAVIVSLVRPMPLHVRLLAIVPAFYLGVHVVYDIGFYYPRHVLAAYFAMGLATMAVAAWSGQLVPTTRGAKAGGRRWWVACS